MMYPFVANWFARCDDVDKHDFSFLKAITIGGSVLETTTANLIKQKLPNIKISQVGFLFIRLFQFIFLNIFN